MRSTTSQEAERSQRRVRQALGVSAEMPKPAAPERARRIALPGR